MNKALKGFFLLALCWSINAVAAPASGQIEGQPWTYTKAFYSSSIGGGVLNLTQDVNATCESFASANSIMVVFGGKPTHGTYSFSCGANSNDCLTATIVGGSMENYFANQGSISVSSDGNSLQGSLSAAYTYKPGISVSGDFIAEICN
jgi:hypothetical protein